MTRSTQGSDPDRASTDSQDSIVASRPAESDARPGAALRLRDSLAARISALVLLVLVAAGASAAIAVGQLRELQRGFDLLDVYVDFTPRLAKARVQAQRIGVQVHNWQAQAGEPSATFEANFRTALLTRNDAIGEAVAVIDGALADPERFGGSGPVDELRRIRRTLEALQVLATLDEDVDPRAVLEDVRTQSQIVHLTKMPASHLSAPVEQYKAGRALQRPGCHGARHRTVSRGIDGHRKTDPPFVQKGGQTFGAIALMMLEDAVQADDGEILAIESLRQPLRLG